MDIPEVTEPEVIEVLKEQRVYLGSLEDVANEVFLASKEFLATLVHLDRLVLKEREETVEFLGIWDPVVIQDHEVYNAKVNFLIILRIQRGAWQARKDRRSWS